MLAKADLSLFLEGSEEGKGRRLPAPHNEVMEEAVQLQDQLLDGHVVPQLLLNFQRGIGQGRIIQHGLRKKKKKKSQAAHSLKLRESDHGL